MSQGIFLSIPDILLDDIYLIFEAIAKSYDENLFHKYEKQYISLGITYFNYKEQLRKEFNKEESTKNEFIKNFHDVRDLYNIVKIFSSEMIKYNMPDYPNIIDKAITKSLARNLGGLEKNGESTLKKYINNINFNELRTMDLVKENIISKDSRFLLLISERSMFEILINIIKKEIEQMNKSSVNLEDDKKVEYVIYFGSPFKGDRMNTSYKTEMIINIEKSVAEGKVIILTDLEHIYPIFYDLFNKNYIKKDGKKYCRIFHGANIQKLVLVNENTKFIVLVDKNDLRSFLNRFEKHFISFDTFLNENDKEKSKTINNILEKLVSVKDINYKLDNILVNTNEDIINGYLYLNKDKENNSYRDIIKEKIIPILSQDIIFTLPLSDLSKEKKEFDSLNNDIQNLDNKYNSLQEYLINEKRGKENILIVYTFSNIGEEIKLDKKENYLERITSEINNEYKFYQILEEFYENKYKTLILKFESENAKYIYYFISIIKNYKEINKIKDDTKKYIFTINIKREFDLEKNKNKVTTVLIMDENIEQLL